jgi:hypothetical protein
MLDPNQVESLWLVLTNVLLGVFTFICIAAVGWIAVREVLARVRERPAISLQHDSHAFTLSDLGITMADGGEKLDENAVLKSSRRCSREEGPHEPGPAK